MLKSFLDKYDTVIFDMDGVVTSEQAYWDAAALTVWEYLKWNKNEDINTKECMEQVADIRKKVFCNDELITVCKGKGVNSNWDLAYVTMCIAWICGVDEDDFTPVLEYAMSLSDNILDEYDEIAKQCSEKTGFDYEWLKRNGVMWKAMQDIFQEWYLGDEIFRQEYGREPKKSGKSGLLFKERPLIDINIIENVLSELSKVKRLCVATGRVYTEINQPITDWGIKKYFAKDGLSNYNHVVEAEQELKTTLTKPHPYTFLKAMCGTDYDNKRIINGDYDKSKLKTTLVVGDAGADILAAKAMGADFCAVLTGVSGKKARGYFEELNSEYILDSIADFIE